MQTSSLSSSILYKVQSFFAYLDHFDGEFKLRVGFEIVQHAVERCGVDVSVARVAGRVAGCVPYNVVPSIGYTLFVEDKKKEREICG